MRGSREEGEEGEGEKKDLLDSGEDASQGASKREAEGDDRQLARALRLHDNRRTII